MQLALGLKIKLYRFRTAFKMYDSPPKGEYVEYNK